MQGVAQRFALPACGRAWTMLGSRKNSKPEKCLKMPQNPTRQVHAVLGVFLLTDATQMPRYEGKTRRKFLYLTKCVTSVIKRSYRYYWSYLYVAGTLTVFDPSSTGKLNSIWAGFVSLRIFNIF